MKEIMSHPKDIFWMLPWISGRTFPLQAPSALHEGASFEAGEEQDRLGLFCFVLLQPRAEIAEKLTCARASAGGCTTTEKQKGEVNAVGCPVLPLKHSVHEHAGDLLCPSPDEDACIPQGQGIAL